MKQSTVRVNVSMPRKLYWRLKKEASESSQKPGTFLRTILAERYGRKAEDERS